MNGFEHLPHTADVKLRAWGATAGEAFAECARAFTNIVTDVSAVKTKQLHSLSLHAPTKEKLLYAFLNELVYLKDTKHFVPCGGALTVLEEDQWTLEGTLSGDVLSEYETHGDVKAPTYHGLTVTAIAGRVVIECVLDI
jgi:SHS2 domain-containing protein